MEIDEALKNEFLIRLFDEKKSQNMEEPISLDDLDKLDNWLEINLILNSSSEKY